MTTLKRSVWYLITLFSMFAIAAITAGLVRAADAPVAYTKASAAPSFDVYNGPWVGFALGYGLKNNGLNFPDGTVGGIGVRPDGALVGLEVGYNQRINASQWIVGLKLAYALSLMQGDASLFGMAQVQEKITGIGDFLARFGYTDGPALIYVTGGGSVATVKTDINSFGSSLGSSNSTRWGWTVGGGADYRVGRQWTAGLEYLYSNFGTQTTLLEICDGIPLTQKVEVHRILAKVARHF